MQPVPPCSFPRNLHLRRRLLRHLLPRRHGSLAARRSAAVGGDLSRRRATAHVRARPASGSSSPLGPITARRPQAGDRVQLARSLPTWEGAARSAQIPGVEPHLRRLVQADRPAPDRTTPGASSGHRRRGRDEHRDAYGQRARRLSARDAGRPGRDGGRLPRLRPGTRAAGRAEDPRPRARGGRALPRALPPRVPPRRLDRPPEHRPRLRRRRGRRRAVHRHALRRRRRAQAAAREAAPWRRSRQSQSPDRSPPPWMRHTRVASSTATSSRRMSSSRRTVTSTWRTSGSPAASPTRRPGSRPASRWARPPMSRRSRSRARRWTGRPTSTRSPASSTNA